MQAPADVRPRFRQDLIAELIEEGGARFVEVAAPDTNNHFRFYEVEYSIACGMDGQRDVAGLVKWAQDELGLTPSPSEIQAVIATLADLRFIGEDKAAVAADAKVAKAAPTEPAKSPAADSELARGVVAGAKAPAHVQAASVDLELGASGAKAQQKSADLPKAPDFDLGASGAPSLATSPRAPADDIQLGAPGSRGEAAKSKAPTAPPASEIAMDLSAHMGVGADDVKDAVKKSKAMTAVDVPRELVEAEAAKPAEKAAAKQPEPVAAKGNEKPGKGKTEAEKKAQSERDKAAAAEKKAAAAAQAEKEKQSASTAVEAKAQDKADKKADKSEKKADKAQDKASADRAAATKKSAVEQPKRPATVAPPAPAGGVSPVLVVMLILALVGAATFFVWKFVLSDAAEQAPKPSAAVPPKPAAPPAPPAVVTSKIALEPQAAQAVKTPVAGTIETIEPADKDVKAGDVIAVLAGGKPLTTEIAKLTKEIEKATPALDAATKTLEEAQQKPDNAAGVTAAQTKLDKLKKPIDEKKATIEKKKADLDKLQIRAVADGKLVEVAKVGQKVAAEEQIAAIVRPSLMVATFKVPPGTKMTADGNLSLVADDKTVVCTVIDAQAETVKVSCPTDGLADGTDVEFTVPK